MCVSMEYWQRDFLSRIKTMSVPALRGYAPVIQLNKKVKAYFLYFSIKN